MYTVDTRRCIITNIHHAKNDSVQKYMNYETNSHFIVMSIKSDYMRANIFI